MSRTTAAYEGQSHRQITAVCMAIALFLGAPLPSAQAQRAPIVSLNTGINRATNLPFAEGAFDLNYTLTTVSMTSTPTQAAYIGGHPNVLGSSAPAVLDTYLVGTAASRWLGVINSVFVPNHYYTLWGNPYTFRTSFDLTPDLAATAQIDGLRTAVDNQLIGISVNDTSVFSAVANQQEEFKAFKEFSNPLGQGLFKSGTNTIDFVLDNYTGGPSPMAFRIEGAVTAVIPEPNTLVLATAAIAAMGTLRRRK